jgi:hypothetical protein
VEKKLQEGTDSSVSLGDINTWSYMFTRRGIGQLASLEVPLLESHEWSHSDHC